MTENKLVPKLRFSGFTKDLKRNGFTELGKIMIGLTHTPKYIEFGKIFLSSKNISKGYIDFENVKYISEVEYEGITKSAKPKKGDILFTRVGSNLGNPVVLEEDIEFAIFVSLGVFRTNSMAINYFLKYWMDTQIFWRQLEKKVAGGAKNNLNTTWLKEFKINIPCLSEQQKIAEFLSSVDNKIQLLEKKKEQLEQYKKGVMQKIFSQDIRFKDDNGNSYPDWEKNRIDNISICLDSKRKPLNSTERNFMRGSIPYYGANGIVDYVNDYLFDEELVLLAEDGGNFFEFANKPIAQLISGRSWVNNHAHILKAKIEFITTDFLFYSLVHKDIRRFIVGGGRVKLNKSDLMSIKLSLPCIEEQKKIANFLSAIYKKIETTSTQIDKTKEFKKGLLQQMFV